MKKSLILILLWQMCHAAVSGRPADPPGPLQVGDNVANAFVLSGPLPLSAGGTTAGFTDDYDEACPYPGNGAPDVVYAYSPGTSVTVDIDLCGSSFDTKLYIYENTVTPGVPYDCNDDFYFNDTCGMYVSKIEGAFLTGGNTYFIVIDGYDEFALGDYLITISADNPPPACTWGADIVCPAGAFDEGETCGSETNGGCSMAPGTENRISVPVSGGTFCGTLWADGGNRDIDEYELVLAETSQVILTCDATQLVQYGLLTGGTGGYGGNPVCSQVTGISPSNTAGSCHETTLDLGFLTPGTYWFSVSLTVNNGFPCSNHYWMRFEVAPQTCPPPADLAASNITTTSATLSWTETGSASSWQYQLGPAGFSPAASGTNTASNPLPVAGLAANTSYDYYVRSNCDVLFSEWTGPYSFKTLCGSVLGVPWSEGFESAWPPDCWSDSATDAYGWDQSTYGAPHTGNEWAYCNLAGSVLSTPSFTPSLPAVLGFWFRVENGAFPQTLTVKAGSDILWQITDATNENYEPVFVSLAGYTGQTISVSFIGETGVGAADFGVCLDDVAVKAFMTWTGNASKAWDNPANWSTSSIPGQSDAVLIPSAPAGNRFPEVPSGITAVCDFIYLSAGSTVRVINGAILDINNP
jgi:hypothetical protein